MSALWLSHLKQQRSIAVIRIPQFEWGVAMAKAVAAGGMTMIEITWNSDRPASLIQRLRAELPDCWIGAGTLLTIEMVQEAIAAGAQFLFTPHVNVELIQTAQAQQVPIVPGALSPTEIVTAWQAGATCVKVFPIQSVGGASYLRHLHAPLGEIPLIPTGGVTLENAQDFLAAGAIAVGLGGQLFPAGAIAAQDWSAITQRVKTLRQTLERFV
ncbi:MAG: bifunctional 4-hydroxy-2-oxoglutarate aldolase/2-dehydro-3-deoxy-phosphogluconate aldolase [Oculatellaceae cyanobacterium Prado106]|jgi:2-dehydro-3-deoxyphosphogluconate aldolase/(4S)-4-hydroxy-2-oxoglutarate aldolase|nr:bifunctional 4-hydroxy-2-oxoglutarate aldolase/2-dehydro-3-deoxy-phosphogluconate aldolase [Oculatellaceae cyanobacterium Prado106]